MREATDTNGTPITWHLFFVDENSKPMALVDYSGTVRVIPATWVIFTEEVYELKS